MQVKSTRKGLTNQLKTLLWRKPSIGAVSMAGRESSPSGSIHGGSVHGGANGGLTAYSGASIESQMRSLADLAFLMQVLIIFWLFSFPQSGNLSINDSTLSKCLQKA